MSEHAFLIQITDAGLRQKIRQMLLDLAMLAQAPALHLEPSVSHTKTRSQAPRGVGEGPDRSLYEFYELHFRQAADKQDEVALHKLLWRSEKDLRWFRYGIDQDRLILQKERDEARDLGLLLEYGEGKHAAIVAEQNSWPIGWVRVMRERNGRDPDYGRERPRWRELDAETRYEVCERLAEEGLTQAEGAKRLGVAQATVNPFWPKQRRLRSVA